MLTTREIASLIFLLSLLTLIVKLYLELTLKHTVGINTSEEDTAKTA